MANRRADHQGEHRTAYEKNRRKILATQDTCAICGRPVDKTLPYPHPMSACIDHIIPINHGGHPSDIDNLQLVHFTCNRQKSDKIPQNISGKSGNLNKNENSESKQNDVFDNSAISNRLLPLSLDWKNF